MLIQSDKIERRVSEAVGALAIDKSFKRRRKMVNAAPEGGSNMLVGQVEPNGWDEV